MEMETYYWSSRWKLSEVLGWSSRVKQQHIFSSTWTCSHSDTSSMVMREMNSESLGRLSSCPCVCVCVCTRVCVCPAALLATASITVQHQAAEHDTHQLDLHTPPLREEACANETRRKRGTGRWGRVMAGNNGAKAILQVRWIWNTLQMTLIK